MSKREDRSTAIALGELLTTPHATPTLVRRNNERPNALNGDERHAMSVADAERINEACGLRRNGTL